MRPRGRIVFRRPPSQALPRHANGSPSQWVHTAVTPVTAATISSSTATAPRSPVAWPTSTTASPAAAASRASWWRTSPVTSTSAPRASASRHRDAPAPPHTATRSTRRAGSPTSRTPGAPRRPAASSAHGPSSRGSDSIPTRPRAAGPAGCSRAYTSTAGSSYGWAADSAARTAPVRDAGTTVSSRISVTRSRRPSAPTHGLVPGPGRKVPSPRQPNAHSVYAPIAPAPAAARARRTPSSYPTGTVTTILRTGSPAPSGPTSPRPRRAASQSFTPPGARSRLVWAAYSPIPARTSSTTTAPRGSDPSSRSRGFIRSGWWVTTRRACRRTASATVRGVGSRATRTVSAGARGSPTWSPGLSQGSARERGANASTARATWARVTPMERAPSPPVFGVVVVPSTYRYGDVVGPPGFEPGTGRL